MIAALPISLYQRVFSSRAQVQVKADAHPEEEWMPFIHVGNVTLHKKHVGEIRFGPEYLSLTSVPMISGLANAIFGDWHHRTTNGLLLQKWNSTAIADADLMFLDARDHQLYTLLAHINNVNWSIEDLNNGSMLFTHDSGKVRMKYSIMGSAPGASTDPVQ